MTYKEVLEQARKNIAPNCKACPECNGLGCGNTIPGPGSKAPGNGANDNWKAWRSYKLKKLPSEEEELAEEAETVTVSADPEE